MKITETDGSCLTARENNFQYLTAGVLFVVVGAGVAYLPGHVSASSGSTASPALLYGFGAIFALAGLASVLARKVVTLTLDKQAGMATVAAKSLFRAEQRQYLLSNIQTVQLAQSTRYVQSGGPGQAGGGTQVTTRLLLLLTDGEQIDLSDATKSSNVFSFFSKPPNEDVGKAIAGFLGIPFQEMTPGAAFGAFAKVGAALLEQKMTGQQTALQPQDIQNMIGIATTMPAQPQPPAVPVQPAEVPPANGQL